MEQPEEGAENSEEEKEQLTHDRTRNLIGQISVSEHNNVTYEL